MHLDVAQHANDRTIIGCPNCGWASVPLSRGDVAARGAPWYCDRCGERVTQFVRYNPGEEAQAKEIVRRHWGCEVA